MLSARASHKQPTARTNAHRQYTRSDGQTDRQTVFKRDQRQALRCKQACHKARSRPRRCGDEIDPYTHAVALPDRHPARVRREQAKPTTRSASALCLARPAAVHKAPAHGTGRTAARAPINRTASTAPAGLPGANSLAPNARRSPAPKQLTEHNAMALPLAVWAANASQRPRASCAQRISSRHATSGATHLAARARHQTHAYLTEGDDGGLERCAGRPSWHAWPAGP